MRVLVIEDSRILRESIETALRGAGYAVDTSGDGEVGLWQAQSNSYDALILDLMLPAKDGLTVLQQLRKEGNDVHVLILTAMDAVEDRVRGLREGADDYLVKPFALDELLARVDALVRRRHGVKRSVIEIGDLLVNLSAKSVTRAGRQIDLAPREYALLEFLATRRGTVVSRSEIEAHLYDANADPMSNVVDAAVYALRKRIDAPGAPSVVLTRRGMGYSLRPPSET